MKHRISHGPVFAVLEVEFDAAEVVIAQPDSMLSMTTGITVAASAGVHGQTAGWSAGFQRLLGGESLFATSFTAKRDGQSLVLAPKHYGDILELSLAATGPCFLTRGAYLAHYGNCELKVQYGGLKGVMAQKGLFFLRAAGEGLLFCQAYGSVLKRTLAAGETFVIDNRFVVAFSESVKFELVKSANTLKDSLFSGEGLVNRYTGPGEVYYQTRGKPAQSWLGLILNAST